MNLLTDLKKLTLDLFVILRKTRKKHVTGIDEDMKTCLFQINWFYLFLSLITISIQKIKVRYKSS